MTTYNGTTVSGVPGIQGNSSEQTCGVYGYSTAASTTSAAIYALSEYGRAIGGTSLANYTTCIVGNNSGIYSTGVAGSTNSNTNAIGVYGSAGYSSAGASGCIGVYGNVLGSTVNGNYAGYFIGSITKSGGSFQIDHPQDPANKHLFHSFVESSEMKNIYDGVAVADASGNAVVNMPAYFEALNKDFRYQLTSIGSAAPNLHVKSEVSKGSFVIGGANPGQKVSWTITGVRQDHWALANPMEVEKEKSADKKGFYRHPELFGKDMGFHEDRNIREKHSVTTPTK